MTEAVPFEHVVAEHGPAVLRVCRAVVGFADADDTWIDTFISALRAYPRLPPGSNVRGWLVTIAHNRSIDHVRAGRRRPIPTDTIPELASTTPDPADVSDDHDELRAALATLGPKQRAAVIYRHLADLPYSEVARLMDVSESAARRNSADGIANLRARLQGAAP